MEFVNRDREMNYLCDEFDKAGSSFVVVYGRRRVGKTRLLLEMLKKKNGLYFLATEESETENIKAFQRVVADYLDDDLLRDATVNNWEAIFRLLVKSTREKKLVLVMDEFQYLAKGNPAFPSIFQKIWDTVLEQENIMVVACGSLVNMMESQLMSYSSPMYGRRSGQIKLGQIAFRHYHAFFPEMDERNLVERYAVTGGVPKYISFFSVAEDLYDAIDKKILAPESLLYEEPIFLLQHEVNEIGNYFSIIKSIASGNQKLGKISADLGVKQSNLTTYLKTLIDLDILERDVPVTEEKPEKSKMGLYRIKDNFIAFWFRFVYANRTKLEQGNHDSVLDEIKRDFVARQAAFVYETICKDKLWQMNESGTLSFEQVGRWWDKEDEIDLVALNRAENELIACECKFTNQPMDTNIFFELLRKMKKISFWSKGQERKERFVLFSISGFTEQLEMLAASRDDLLLVTS